MTTPNHTPLECALEALRLGYAPIPITPGEKIPAVKWKCWQDELPPEDLVRQWFADARRNLAIVTAGLVVFDCDDPEKVDRILAECGPTPHQLRTPRGGFHLAFRRRRGVALRNQVKVRGLPIDIRTDGGLELLPPSCTENGSYEWIGAGLQPRDELPVARIGWTRERSRKQTRRVVELPADLTLDRHRLVNRARAYIATIPGAVSGRGGHNTTFRVACVLVKKFQLTEQEAWPLLLEWNQKCEPPWSERDLEHKLSDALRQPQ